jgi:hypothetical protein
MSIGPIERSEFADQNPAKSTSCHFDPPLNRPRPLAPYLCVMAGRSEEPQDWSEMLQTRLRAKMDKLIIAFETTTDPAEKAQIEKDARTCGVFARSAKAIETMVPEPPAEKIKPAADEAAKDDEASMHDGIPDDPDEIQAALAARFDRFAELIELKRRAELADGGDADAGPGGPAAPA